MIQDELIDEGSDVTSLIQHHTAVLIRLKQRLDDIKRRKAEAGKTNVVSDHAIVRYLERTGIVDIGAVRRKLREMAKEAKRFKGNKKAQEHCWHPDGLVLIVARNGNIVTVLGHDQVEKFEGRKLANGERVPVRTLAEAISTSDGQS